MCLVVTIIVNYNSANDTLRLIKSFESISYDNHKIVIVDNCSIDNSFDLLKESVKNNSCYLIKNHINNGYGGGINYGHEYAKQFEPAYVQIINSDTEVINPEYLKELVGVISSRECVGAVGPAVLAGDKTSYQNTIFPFISFSSILSFRRKYSKIKFLVNEEIIDVPCLNGVCLLVDINAFERVGGFDEKFFMYCEEQDFCYRLHLSGYSVLHWSGKSIIHYGSDIISESIDKRYLLRRSNQIRYLMKYKKKVTAVVVAMIFSLSITVKLTFGLITLQEYNYKEIIKFIFNPIVNYRQTN